MVLYDKVENPIQVRDYNGNIHKTQYNSLNLPFRVYDPAPFDTLYSETVFYKTGKVKTVTDRRKNATAYEYDELNRVVKVTDPLSQTIVTTYDKVGNVKSVKDKREILTENDYDELNRLKEKRRAAMRLVTNEYDGVGNLRFVTDANGNRTENQYNKRNLLETVIHPDTNTEKKSYDGVGNLLTDTDEEQHVTTYTYDKENRQTSVELAGEKTDKEYDPVGNLIVVIKPEANSRTMGYDGLKRLSSVTEGSLTTRYEYDANGNLRHQYDPRGNDVEYVWDVLNRKTALIQHKGTGDLVDSYGYDEEGNLNSQTDAKGQQFSYTFDALNRKTDEKLPLVTTPYLATTSVHTEHDGNNNVISVTETKTDTGGATITDSTTNTYDDFDRLKTSDTRGVTVSYDYDNNGNRTLVSTPSGSTTYTYYPRNWVKTAVAGAKTTAFDYYPDGKKKTVSYPNGAAIAYTYFTSNWVKTVINTGVGDTVISQFIYEYDKNGNRTSQIETRNGSSETTSYRYDTLDRLQSFTVSDGSDTTTTDYTFDGYNRASETVSENGATVTTRSYSYDETDWLTNVQVSEAGIDKTINYTYDKNGNTIKKQDTSETDDVLYDYDASNQLVRAMKGTSLLGLYDYNSEGLRIRHHNGDRGDVDYWYDGKAVIEERKASGGLLAHYRYANKPLSLMAGGENQYYHFDGLGSTVNLTNAAGVQQAGYFLDPWGHIKEEEGDSVNRQIFTGQEHDENTGLIYFGQRYYDPDTARFITEDSYLGKSDTPPSLNRYLYAYSNPTVFVDLEGYESEKKNWLDKAEEWFEKKYKAIGKWFGDSHAKLKGDLESGIETRDLRILGENDEADKIAADIRKNANEYGKITEKNTTEATKDVVENVAPGVIVKGASRLRKIVKTEKSVKKALTVESNAGGEAIKDIEENSTSIGTKIKKFFDDLTYIEKKQPEQFSGTSKNAKWVKSKQGAEGSGLRDHFRKHGEQVGAKTLKEYDKSARQTIEKGRKFSYRDRETGERRIGYYDQSTGLFTATSQTRKNPAILTHFPETWKNLRKLPGFSVE